MLYPDWVHVAIVACGDRQPETSVAVKAIMLTATDNVFVHIFTEDDLRPAFQKEVLLCFNSHFIKLNNIVHEDSC